MFLTALKLAYSNPLVRRLALIGVCTACLITFHNVRVNRAVATYKVTRDLADAQALSQAQTDAQAATLIHEQALSEISTQLYTQDKTDEKTILDLRNRIRAGNAGGLCDARRASFNPASPISPTASGDAASATAASGSDADSERVIRLGEIALQSLNALEAAQGVINADRAALNPFQSTQKDTQ